MFKKKAVNWFAVNIGNGRLVTPFDINKRPRQYRIWSGRKFDYPRSTAAPKSVPRKQVSTQ